MPKAERTVAKTGKLLTKSGFSGYDACMNPYVGCEFGCSYCYVRFFIKDPKPWGEFVRVRLHMADKLPKELNKGYLTFDNGSEAVHDAETGETTRRKRKKTLQIADTRLVIGTMTDPYQPAENKFRITRTALKILTDSKQPQFHKVGIFTRSPMVVQDIELIKKLPRARVHFTVTPYPQEILRAIEPYSARTSTRWEVVRKLKEAGLRVHVNVAPVLPGISEPFIEEFVEKLIDLGVDEYFVDPMQPYKESFDAFRQACRGLPNMNWPKIEATMLDKDAYLEWKVDFLQAWQKARVMRQSKMPHQLPIWCDHKNKVWVDMRHMVQLDWHTYDRC